MSLDLSGESEKDFLFAWGTPHSWRQVVETCLPEYKVSHLDRLPDSTVLPQTKQISLGVWAEGDYLEAVGWAAQFKLPVYLLSAGPLDRPGGPMALRSLMFRPLNRGGLGRLTDGGRLDQALGASSKLFLQLMRGLADKTAFKQAGPTPVLLLIRGNESKSSLRELAKLAKLENPGSPLAFQAVSGAMGQPALSWLKTEGIEHIKCLGESASRRAYTIDSPQGFEALMLGYHLTVTGAPYYAGWGLTDDRPVRPNEEQLSLTDFFSVVALGYSRYAAAPHEPVVGLLAAILTEAARQAEAEVDGLNKGDRRSVWAVQFLAQKIRKYGRRGGCRGFTTAAAQLFLDWLTPALSQTLIKECRARTTVGDSFYQRSLEAMLAGESKSAIRRGPVVTGQAAAEMLRKRRINELEASILSLLAEGRRSPELFESLAASAHLRFMFRSAAQLGRAAAAMFPFWGSRSFWRQAALNYFLAGNPASGLCWTAAAYLGRANNPNIDLGNYGLEKLLNRAFGRLPWTRAMVAARKTEVKKKNTINWAMSLARAEHYDEAVAAARMTAKSQKQAACLTLAYRFLRRFDEAWKVLEPYLAGNPSAKLCNEALRLCLWTNDYQRGLQIINEADARGINLEAAVVWMVLSGAGQLAEAFRRHGKAPYFQTLKPYLGSKLADELPSPKVKPCRLLIISECFPGDELRFSRLYPQMIRLSGADEVKITCDFRLYCLLSRSFPELDFVAVHKADHLAGITDLKLFDQLPGADCSRYLDNVGWRAAAEADLVVTVMHALPAVLDQKVSLEELPNLKAAPELITEMIARLPGGSKVRAGLAWRSSVFNYDRNAEMSRLKDIAPLLDIDGIQWINCQYDGCTPEEGQYLDRYYPGRLATLEGLDQVNDLDKTAALHTCLDFMVSAPTSTADLSACLGVPTICMTRTGSSLAFAAGTGHHFFSKEYQYALCRDDRERRDLFERVRTLGESLRNTGPRAN